MYNIAKMKRHLVFVITCGLYVTPGLMAQNMQMEQTHPRIVTTLADKKETLDLIATHDWAKKVVDNLRKNLSPYEDESSDYLSSRLYMNWKTKAKEVFIKGEYFSHNGEDAAPVPTVMFSGARSHATNYARPSIEDRLPYADETKGVYMHNKTLPGNPLEWIHPSKAGTQIESGNCDIMNKARDAAFLWWLTGEEKYGRMAASVLDTYLSGIYYRDVPYDLNHGHQQTLVGMTSFEVIHDGIVSPLTVCYDFLYDYLAEHYADKMSVYSGALKKIADVIALHGVPHNNWDIIQARFIFDIALVLEDDEDYVDRKGRQHYINVVVNDSTLRQWSLKTLAGYGFDEQTGIWGECPGYSCNVVNDYADFALLFDKYFSRDLVTEIPVIEKAVAATPQYCFPNGKIVGFGDTHPSLLRTSYFASLIKNAQKYGKRKQEEKFTAMWRCFEPESVAKSSALPSTGGNLLNLYPQEKLTIDTTIAAGCIERYVSPTFYAPNVSWVVQRNGMDAGNSLMYSLNGSEGNHQHANGLSVEFYGKGVTLAPDAGIGQTLYSGLDYLEYYSQFPSHNTVCVDGVSSYPVMKSNHPVILLNCYPSATTAEQRNLLSDDYYKEVCYTETYFREPETRADQTRLLSIVNTENGKGYYVDIFRSRKELGGDKMHDYFYHNLGQEMKLTATDGTALDFRPSEELSFAGAHLYAYSYIYNQQVVETDKDIKAQFTIHPDNGGADIYMTMWQQGMKNRKIFQALSPETEGLSRDRTMPYKIAGSPTLTYVARQYGEAWTKPFVSVFEPSSSEDEGAISNVSFFTPSEKNDETVGIEVTLKSGRKDYIFSATKSAIPMSANNMTLSAGYACISMESDIPVRIFLSNATAFRMGRWRMESKIPADVSLMLSNGEWYYTASQPCKLTVDGKSRKVERSSKPVKW